MRGSILVFGGSLKARNDKIEALLKETYKPETTLGTIQNIPDIKLIDLVDEKKSIGILQAKEGTKFLTEKPFFYKAKTLIIQNADKMTTEAQNSLLKTLEEPPATALIILSAKNENSLLETVLSRCKRLPVTQDISESLTESKTLPNYKTIRKMPIGEKLAVADELGALEKEEIIEFLEKMLAEAKDEVLVPQDLKLIYEFIGDLENTNVSAKFGIERLLMLLK